MGWSTGVTIFAEIAEIISAKQIDEDDRLEIYKDLIELFLHYDCDNLAECQGIDYILDEALVETGVTELNEEE